MLHVPHRPPGIHSLPVELLTRIFVLGVQDESPYHHSPFLLKPDQHYYSAPSSNFQLLVSHVCHHWRQITLRTPSLWTSLHFREPSHLPRAREFLARCAHSPRTLDILVDTVSQEDHIPGVTLYTEELHAVFKLVVPHVKRWRAFHLKIRDNDCKGIARLYLGSCGPAPRLETLQLYHFEDYRTVQNLYIATYRPPVVVFSNELPSLKNVSLIGVNLPWEKSPYLVGLQNLELALHSDNIRPPYEYWDSMLRGSPNLQTLTIHYSGPRAANGEPKLAWPGSKERIYIQSLQELNLTDLDPDYLCLVMERLVLPGVKRLSIHLPDQDYTPFIDLITHSHSIDSSNTTSIFSTSTFAPSSLSSSPPASEEADNVDIEGPTTFSSASISTSAHQSAAPSLLLLNPSSPASSTTVSANGILATSSPVSPTATLTSPYLEAQFSYTPFPFIGQLESLTVHALECSTASWRTLLGLLDGLRMLEMDFTRVGQDFLKVLMEGRTRIVRVPNSEDNKDHNDSEESDVPRTDTELWDNTPGSGTERRERSCMATSPSVVHVPYLPFLHTFKVFGLPGREVRELVAYRQSCVEELRIKKWIRGVERAL
ncbi:hypothetical protein AX16_007988 [Volvariella volvacea WC 439]|nr:hypothetical protein AX16_007988 [Volvariella volvacea WC 439]